MSDSNNTIPEGFRVIPGYPRYAIDENGTVLSVCPSNGKGKNKPWANATCVKKCTDSWGYHMVNLRRDGRTFTTTIHKLVLLTFVGPCPDGMECRHLDGNQLNNHATNLAWGTPVANSNDKILHGTTAKGENVGMSKLTEENVLSIRSRYANGEKQLALAMEFSVTQTHISRIVLRRKWKHI